MSSQQQWGSNTITPDVDDFIIPDDDFSAPPPQPRNQQSTSNIPQASSSSPFSPFNLVPKVDLSSTFTSFAASTSAQLPENTKVKERQYTGGDTLDEPILETLKRDLLQIGKRLTIVVWPMQLKKLAQLQQNRFLEFASTNGVQLPQLILNSRVIPVSEEEEGEEEEAVTGISSGELITQDSLDWDLWGPLIFSLTYSVALGLSASKNQTNQVFSGSFAFIWILYVIIGLNVQLLGGTISFMSAISAIGYSMFPIVIGELICSLVLKWKFIRLILMLVLNLWSIYAGVMSLKCSGVLPGRVLLAIYPVILFYSVLSWLTVIT